MDKKDLAKARDYFYRGTPVDERIQNGVNARIKRLQTGEQICPVCGSKKFEKRNGKLDSAITGAGVGAVLLSGGALLLPFAAFQIFRKKEWHFKCKECQFTYSPMQPMR